MLRHHRSYEEEASCTFPLDEEGKVAAIQAAVGFGGYDFMPKSGGLASRGDTRVWACVTHVDCPAKLKVVSEDSVFELFCWTDVHSEQRAALPSTFKGISAEFDSKVQELVGQGLSPKWIHAELVVWCGDDESKKGRIPTKSKIAARLHKLKSSPLFKFETFAHLKMWAEDKLIDSKAKFEAVVNVDELLVYSLFYEEIDIPDELEGAAEGAMIETSTFGFIFGSKKTALQFRDVRHFVHAHPQQHQPMELN